MSDEIVKPKPETYAEIHEQYLENLAPKAEKIMNDERLDFFRSRLRRRVLASFIFIIGLVILVNFAVDFDRVGSWLIYSLIALYMSLIFFGSRVARGFLELPDELVDERIVQRRTESYVYTFHMIMTLLCLLIPVLLFSGAKSYNFTETISDPIGGIIGFTLLVSSLPAIVFLWREPEL